MGLSQFDNTDVSIRLLESRERLNEAATSWMAERIHQAIALRGQASLALSGGSTPKPVYKALSQKDLLWESVTATLVDDRLNAGPEGSNAVMIADLLIQEKAAKLKYKDLANHQGFEQFDIALMGMGTDGHTASWFPGSPDLPKALDPNADKAVMTIDAQNCAGAGHYPQRITLTLPAVMNSRDILLLISGEEKLRVFESAGIKSVFEAPVKALLAAGSRLTVMWAP